MTITEYPEEVSKQIIEHLGRGATILQGKGAFTGESRPVVMVILRTRQLSLATNIVKEADPQAFTFVHDVTEVIGHGFKPPVI